MCRFMASMGSVVVALTMTSVAWGTNYVWLEAEPLSGGAVVVEDGQGHAVSLECDPSQQLDSEECRWRITVRIANEDPMFAWTLDLGTLDDNTSILGVGYLDPLYSTGGTLIKYVPFDGPLTAIPGSGRNLLRNLGAGTISAVVPATESPDGIAWDVAEFILSKTVTDTDSGFVEIFGRTGVGAYGPAPGEDFPAEVGDNPVAPIEQPLTIYPNALITIAGPQGDAYIPPGDGGAPVFSWDDSPDPGGTGDDNDPPSQGDDSGVQDSGNPPASDDGNPGDGSGGVSGFNGSQGGIAISQGGSNQGGNPFAGLCGTSGVPTLATLSLMFATVRRRRRTGRRVTSN